MEISKDHATARPDNKDSDFIVKLRFSAAARQWLDMQSEPIPSFAELLKLQQHVQAGDFFRLQGLEGIWTVLHRTWNLKKEQKELAILLDGPLPEDDE